MLCDGGARRQCGIVVPAVRDPGCPDLPAYPRVRGSGAKSSTVFRTRFMTSYSCGTVASASNRARARAAPPAADSLRLLSGQSCASQRLKLTGTRQGRRTSDSPTRARNEDGFEPVLPIFVAYATRVRAAMRSGISRKSFGKHTEMQLFSGVVHEEGQCAAKKLGQSDLQGEASEPQADLERASNRG